MEWCVGSRTLLRTPDRLPCEGCHLRVPVTLEVCRSLACSARALVNDPGIARDEIPGRSVGVDAFSFGTRAASRDLEGRPAQRAGLKAHRCPDRADEPGCVGTLAFAAGIAAARGGWRSVAGASSRDVPRRTSCRRRVVRFEVARVQQLAPRCCRRDHEVPLLVVAYHEPHFVTWEGRRDRLPTVRTDHSVPVSRRWTRSGRAESHFAPPVCVSLTCWAMTSCGIARRTFGRLI